MKRFTDWPERLAAYVQSKLDAPFAWGTNDCATFADGAVEAMTGERVFSADYSTEIGAAKEILSRGGVTAALTEAFGEPITPTMIQRGDVAVVMEGDNEMIVVCADPFLVSPGEAGLVMRRSFTTDGKPVAVRAWKVAR